MPTYEFHQLDVFTDTPLTGNALAVFPEADGLDDETMQAIAREMNLSETTFVFPSSKATKRVRIYTPESELPLAGHPTIGTWWLLAELGAVEMPPTGTHRITQETGAGVLPVDIELEDGKPTKVVMLQPLPEFGKSSDDSAQLGAALGADGNAVLDHPAPQVVATALPQLMVPMSSSEILGSLPRGGGGPELAQLLRQLGTDCAMCYVMRTTEPKPVAHCRMFAPGLGVPEDPATGSAAGALGSYLVWHNVLRPQDGVCSFAVEQGVEIDRPSLIDVEIVVGNGGEITEVRVGGKAITVLKGELSI